MKLTIDRSVLSLRLLDAALGLLETEASVLSFDEILKKLIEGTEEFIEPTD